MIPYVSAIEHFGMGAMITQRHPLVSDWLERCKKRPSFDAAIRAPVPKSRWDELASRGADAWEALRPTLAAA